MSLEPPWTLGRAGSLNGGSFVGNLDFGHFRAKYNWDQIVLKRGANGGFPDPPRCAGFKTAIFMFFFVIFLVPDRSHASGWPENGPTGDPHPPGEGEGLGKGALTTPPPSCSNFPPASLASIRGRPCCCPVASICAGPVFLSWGGSFVLPRYQQRVSWTGLGPQPSLGRRFGGAILHRLWLVAVFCGGGGRPLASGFEVGSLWPFTDASVR